MSDSAGPAPASPQESTDTMLKAYVQNLPALFNVTSSGTPKMAAADLAAAQQTTPGYNALALQQIKDFVLPMATAQSANNAALLAGAGGDAARAASDLSKSISPEYDALRKKITGGAGNLIDSINLNGLSGGERAEVERSLNQSNTATGNLGVDNATNAVRNAMQFGDRLSQKRSEMAGALGAGAQAMGTQDQSFNPVAIALGGPAGTATGFQTTSSQNAGQQANQFGSSALGSIANMQVAQNALNADYNWKASDRWRMNQIGANIGSCCFIFLEIYNGELPWYVRVERDKYYTAEPRVAGGYKRMAKWLVPLMQRWPIVRHVVNYFMVKPLTAYGGHTHKVNSFGHIFAPVKWFWFTIWKHTSN